MIHTSSVQIQRRDLRRVRRNHKEIIRPYDCVVFEVDIDFFLIRLADSDDVDAIELSQIQMLDFPVHPELGRFDFHDRVVVRHLVNIGDLRIHQ